MPDGRRALTATVLSQSPTPATVEKSERDAVIEALATKLSAGYVLPEAVGRITQALRSANTVGEYDGETPQEFCRRQRPDPTEGGPRQTLCRVLPASGDSVAKSRDAIDGTA